MKIISKPIPFLTDRWGVLFSSMFVTIWLGLGYYMVIYLTALANIDESLYEAASLDGAGPVRQFIYVTMPGVRSTMMLIMMLSTIPIKLKRPWITSLESMALVRSPSDTFR